MIGAILVVSLAASGAGPGGCADHWTVELSTASFANNGAGRTFTAAELEAFRAKAHDQLKSAIGDACRTGVVKAGNAKDIQRVTVSSASGASDPFLYPSAKGTLQFEWIFAEENLALPPARDIIAGAACWIDAKGPACASGGD
jgi:hypothetical protein